MSTLPCGYQTFREAGKAVEATMFPGSTTAEFVNSVERAESDAALERCWEEVDNGRLRLMLIGGNPRRIIRISPKDTFEIPFLRKKIPGRVIGLSYLRAMHPMHSQMVSWFGPDFSQVVFAVREMEVRRVVKNVMRGRRRAEARSSQKQRGRPSDYQAARPIICELIETKKWSCLDSIKSLTSLVNKFRRMRVRVSDDSVGRYLQRIWEETGDSSFKRVKRERAKKKRRISDVPPLR